MKVFENENVSTTCLPWTYIHQVHPIAKVYGSKIVGSVIQSPSVYDLKASER